MTPIPKPSLSTPAASSHTSSLVLPTPSSSTSTNSTRQQVEQQIAEHEKLLQESNSGIGKNVLIRQINQLKEKLKEMDHLQQQQKPQLRRQVLGSNTTTSMDDMPPATLDKLRSLERDVSSYRSPRLLGSHPIPSPSSSGLDSSSLLPLPPPPSGSTPTKRRSKVPNSDRRNTDIEFATEIGQGLLLEVRKMQALLQEKEEQLNQLEIQKADLERAAEAMAKQLRQREEIEERLKEDTWNLELAKQELTISVTELQQNLHKSSTEQNRLNKQVNDLRSEIEKLRSSEEKLQSIVENMKQRHEQDMSSIRRHAAGLQREKLDQKKQIDTLTSELAIAKAQTRIAKRSYSDIHVSMKNKTDTIDMASSGDASGTDREGQSPKHSPPGSPKQTPTRNQALEVETLKTSLAHAHRMVSNLRSNLHREKTEKFELKKLLAESQETIEQLQNEPRMWEDASSRSTSDVKRSHKANGGSSSKRRKGSTRRKRVGSRTPKANDIEVVDSFSDELSSSSDEEEEGMMMDPQLMQQNDLPSTAAGFTPLSSELAAKPKEMTLGDQLSMALSSPTPVLPRSTVDVGTQTELEIDNRHVQTEVPEAATIQTRNVATEVDTNVDGKEDGSDSTTTTTTTVVTKPIGVNTSTETVLEEKDERSTSTIIPIETTSIGVSTSTEAATILEEKGMTATVVKVPELQMVDMPSISATPVEQQTQQIQSDSMSVPVDAGVTADIIQPQQAITKETDTVSTQTNPVKLVSMATGSDSAIWNDSTTAGVTADESSSKIESSLSTTVITRDLAIGSTQTVSEEQDTVPLTHYKQQQQSNTKDIIIGSTANVTAGYVSALNETTSQSPAADVNKPIRVGTPDQVATTAASALAMEAEHAFDCAPRSYFSQSSTEPNNTKVASSNDAVHPAHIPAENVHNTPAALGEETTATAYPPQPTQQKQQQQLDNNYGPVQQSSSVIGNKLYGAQNNNESVVYGDGAARSVSIGMMEQQHHYHSASPYDGQQAPQARGIASGDNNRNSNNNLTADDGSNIKNYGDTRRAPQWMANGTLEAPRSALSQQTNYQQHIDGQEEPKTLTQSEADGMVARAVEAALNAYRKQEKRATLQQQQMQQYHSMHSTDDGERSISETPGTVVVLDESKYSHPINDDQPPARPSSPPPSTLLSKAAARSLSVSSKVAPQPQGPFNTEEYGTAYVNTHTMTYSSRRRESGSVSSVSTSNTTTDRRPSITSSQLDAAARGAQGISDPNAIALITQTMIGDWMYKYTRKAVGNGLSERRHKRFFWIHPYTRTLYWSAFAPGVDGRESKAKSAFIEDVSAIPDYTSNPPGLPQVSLLIQTPGRQLKITAPDTSKHGVWYESLSYLLARANTGDGMSKKSIDRRDITESVSTSAVSILKKPSFQRLRPVRSISSIAGSARSVSSRSRVEDDDDDEGLEDVRMCCNGKHHVSKLEKDHHHHNHHHSHYRNTTKRSQLSS